MNKSMMHFELPKMAQFTYRCTKCGAILMREFKKRWFLSLCTKHHKTVRVYLVRKKKQVRIAKD